MQENFKWKKLGLIIRFLLFQPILLLYMHLYITQIKLFSIE